MPRVPRPRLDDLQRDLGHARTALRDLVLERVRSPVTVHALHLVAGLLAEASTTTPSSAFYDRLCSASCELTGLRRALVLLYDEPLRDVRAAGSHGLDVELFDDVHAGMAPVALRALAEDRVLVIDAAQEDALPPRYVERLGLRTVLIAPMSAGGRGYGVLLADRGPEDFAPTEAQQDLLWAIGKGAALATASRLAARQQERAKALQDRIDLAREVHDGVVQRLFGVSLALSSSGELPAESRERCREEVQLALEDLRNAINRPLGRRPPETTTTLHEVLRATARRHPDLDVGVTEGEDVAVPPHLEPIAQSVLAEAVRNARKHADPTRLAVRLQRRGETFVLAVVNDGVSEARTHAHGLGLRLAAFEALQQGGLLEYGPRDGAWEVKLTMPVAADG